MKTLLIVECKTCGAKFAGESIPLVKKGDEIDFMLKAIGRCSACRAIGDRSTGGMRYRPGNFHP